MTDGVRMRAAVVSGGVLCAALTLLSCLLPAAARAEVGGLDPAFGEGGITTTPLDLAARQGYAEIGVGPDGSPVVGEGGGYRGFLVRFDPDGSLDTIFGEGGKLLLSPENRTVERITGGVKERHFRPRDLVVDGQGRLLVFGSESDARRSFYPGTIMAEKVLESRAVVLRLTPEGEPDPSFGDGRGFVRSAFGLRTEFPVGFPSVATVAGGVDSRDRPVLIAGVATTVGGCYAKGHLGTLPRAVVRLTESGRIDRSFAGGDGVAPITGSTSFPGLGIDAADRPVAGVGSLVHPEPECRRGTTLIRLRANGARMRRFGPRGTRAFRRVRLAFAAPSGAVVLASRHRRTLRVARVGLSGRPDKRFGTDGTARVRLPVAFGNHVWPVAADAQGRILLAGFLGRGEPFRGERGPKHSFLVVARLLPDGRMDPSFGDGGWIIGRVPEPLAVTSTAATLDPQGRLLLAATVTAPDQEQGGYLLARYLLGP